MLDEWLPYAKRKARDEALAELARRYFTSHGPATVQDFAWWSGLAPTDALAGLEANQHLVKEVIDGQTYWLASSKPGALGRSRSAFLLPAFDEYTVAYTDRRAVLDPVYAKRADSGYAILNPTIVINGQVIGTWKRTFEKGSVVITLNPFTALTKIQKQAVGEAAEEYGRFLDMPVVVAK